MPHHLWIFKGAGVDSDLSALPFGQFSTARSNGTNKVIERQCTFLVFLPVFAEAHPRRKAPPAASSTSFIFSNPFRSCSLRTLASYLKTNVSSNSFEIRRFRTLCKIPGIGYPLASSPPSASLFLLFPEITQRQEIRPSEASPLSFFSAHGSRVTYSFRINTCKSVSKQMTLTPCRMNTYEKTGGEGVPSPSIQNFIPKVTSMLGCPTKVVLRDSSISSRGGRS